MIAKHWPRILHFGMRMVLLAALFHFVWLQSAYATPWQTTSTAERIAGLRSITYYPYPSAWNQFDLDAYHKALTGMKTVGANTVWLILPWHEFQSQALPKAKWVPGALKNLKKAVELAQQEGMNVILPLCYIGEGWEPTGIDARVWTVDKKMYGAFESYIQEMVRQLGDYENILYLLYTESCNPIVSRKHPDPRLIDSFRQWCRGVNPDITFWNQRWGSNYTWDDLVPPNPAEAATIRYTDYWRWTASILRECHGGLARKIKRLTGTRALLGYHDYCIIIDNIAAGESPLPDDNPYDFLSINRYYGYYAQDGMAGFEKSIDTALGYSRKKYPHLPLAMLETGSATYEVGFGGQADVIDLVTRKAQQEKIGVNFWMWQDFMDKHASNLSECSFGFLTPAGAHKPAYEVLSKRWKH